MKKKKFLIVAIIIVLLIVLLVYFLGFTFKNTKTLTLEENKWIDQNKYDVIDLALLNDIPVLSYEGEGLVYDYIDYISKEYSLKFNVLPFKLDTNVEYDYTMNIVDNPSKEDIELMSDNLVLLTFNNNQYNDISEISNLKIGILSEDKQLVSEYLSNDTITYVEFDNYSDLKQKLLDSKKAFDSSELQYDLDGIIALKTICIKELIENNLSISYQFNDLIKYYTLSLKGNKNLNSILKKTFDNWSYDNYEEKYNYYLLNNYYDIKELSDVERKTLKSKNYVYGFINYGIYSYLEGNKISGLNGIILKEFNKFSGLSITYTRYNSLSRLVSDFNKNKIDFMFDIASKDMIKIDVYDTSNILKKELAIISHNNDNKVIDNFKSLKNHQVLVVKDSYLEDYLVLNKIKYKSYNNINDMIKDFDNGDILLMDIENYNYYKTTSLKNSKINYIFNLEDGYSYIVNNKEDNKLFEELFDFYLKYNSIDNIVAENYSLVAQQNNNVIYILIIIIVALLIYVVLDFINHIKVMLKTLKQSKKTKLTKEEKIMYIDQLTSLKNRAYFNSRIESWDESEVYPQSIIIMDLNNISYINDNYGREEGDKVIAEAANILIQNQLSNSEIIRTDGNEFLIYLVGYNEKQIISYLRKLSKDFKNLSHGFGVASGYSIITDAIKTIDDAVNEATIAMKENKEDIDY